MTTEYGLLLSTIQLKSEMFTIEGFRHYLAKMKRKKQMRFYKS